MARFLLLVALVLMMPATASADVLRVGRALPNVSLVSDGKLVNLKTQIKGKTLVHIFASW